MNMELITSAASDALVNVVLAIIALAGAYGVYYIRLGAAKLKEQTAQIKDEAGRKVLEDALDDVVNLATVSVGAMEQTTAKALRDAVKNGTASREELLALGKQVFDEVKAAIAPEAQQVITDNLGSFDKYLTAVIEDAVLHIKNEDPYAERSAEDGRAVPQARHGGHREDLYLFRRHRHRKRGERAARRHGRRHRRTVRPGVRETAEQGSLCGLQIHHHRKRNGGTDRK